jgi:hypothetical protein
VIKSISLNIDLNLRLLKPEYDERFLIFTFCAEVEGFRSKIVGIDEPIELNVYKGTVGPDVVDVTSLTAKGLFTYDPGFVSTAACESKITYIDGNAGVLLHRGYPIDQLAQTQSPLRLLA